MVKRQKLKLKQIIHTSKPVALEDNTIDEILASSQKYKLDQDYFEQCYEEKIVKVDDGIIKRKELKECALCVGRLNAN